MANREDDLGSHVNKDLPSSSSCVDTARVIMWLKTVGESRADAFWKKFSFPPMSGFYFLPRGLFLPIARRKTKGE